MTSNNVDDVYKTGVTGSEIEYKLYADNSAHNLKLYVSEMQDISNRTFDILVNGEVLEERYTLSKGQEVIELSGIYPSNGVITVKLQHAYSQENNTMTNPILNGIVADKTPMAPVNMRIDAGNTDTVNMANHDGLFADAKYNDKSGSGYYEVDGKASEQVNSQLGGGKPNPDAGMGTALKSGRAGENFGYKFKVSPGNYRVKLYFNDTSSDTFSPANFDILINGEVVKENFNIEEQAGGKDKATDLTFNSKAKNGLIDIEFKAKNGQKALVNAVVVEPFTSTEQENLATNKTVTASAKENDNTKESYAVDGNNSTRWCSGNSNGEHWISVDLGKNYMIDKTMIDWTPGAYATTYRIETSTDANSWNVVKRMTDVYPGLNVVDFDTTEARYVRIVAEKYNDQWGMSMTELGVYGEEITGRPASTVDVLESEENKYDVKVGLEHIYNKYRNVTVSMNYNPNSVTFVKEQTTINEKDLLSTSEPTIVDNEDGTKTVSYALGIKNQGAFKEANNVLNARFDANEGATRSEVKVDISFSSAEGHITNLEEKIAYVPNNFTYKDLQSLIRDAQELFSEAEVGTKPGSYPQDAMDKFSAVITEVSQIENGQEESVYEQAYLKLEKAIKEFKDSVNVNQYKGYHADYSVDTTADYTYKNASGAVKDGALVLDLKENATASDNNAIPLKEGRLHVKFSTNSIEDQTLFRMGNIRVGYDKGGNNWFYDSAKNGYGNFTTGKAPTVNDIHDMIIDFTANENNTYNVSITFDDQPIGSLSNLQYDVAEGVFQFETRRAPHQVKLYEVYYTNAPRHDITVNVSGNGTVNHSGNVVYYEETEKTFVFTPNEGYEVDKVLLNGEKVPVVDNKFTIDSAGDNDTLDVSFRQIQSAVNKDELQNEVNEFETKVPEEYTFATWNEYKKAYNNAKVVLSDSTATQEEVDSALEQLKTAKDNLEKIEEEADKTALKALMDKVNGLSEENYTEESFANLMTAKAEAQAILDKAEATQKEVDNALVKLQKAFDLLEEVTVPPVVDKTALQALMDKVNGLSEENYTEESFANLMTAKAEAQAVLDKADATQEEIDNALSKLQKAFDLLEEVTVPPVVDKTALQALMDKVNGLSEENYTEESFANLMTAKAEAQAVLDKADATQEEVDNALAKLQKAFDDLKEVSTPEKPNKPDNKPNNKPNNQNKPNNDGSKLPTTSDDVPLLLSGIVAGLSLLVGILTKKKKDM